MKHLLTIAILLVAGAVANIAVAWAFSLWAPGTSVGPIIVCNGLVSGGFDATCVSARASSEPVNGFASHVILRCRAGWPTKSLCGERRQQVGWGVFAELPATPSAVFVSAIPPPQFLKPLPNRFLPLAPLWPSFLLSTLLYALLFALLVYGPLLLRQLLRTRAGLCPNCAYPIGTSSACSECGTPLATHAVA